MKTSAIFTWEVTEAGLKNVGASAEALPAGTFNLYAELDPITVQRDVETPVLDDKGQPTGDVVLVRQETEVPELVGGYVIKSYLPGALMTAIVEITTSEERMSELITWLDGQGDAAPGQFLGYVEDVLNA